MVGRACVHGCKGSRTIASAILIGSGVLAAALLGGGLGAAGAVAAPSTHGSVTVGVALVVLGACLTTHRPWQIDHETAGGWLSFEDWRTAAMNGTALGLGASTRLGFWLWYALPLGAWAAGSAWAGATVLAVYAMTRLTLSASLTQGVFDFLGRRIRSTTSLLDVVAAAVLGWTIGSGV